MRKIRLILMIGVLIFGLGMGSKNLADTTQYTVKPILPDNQAEEGLGYFNLLLAAGQKQQLQVELSNTTEEPVEIEVALANAVTNDAGVVDYAPTKISADSSLKYPLTTLAKVPKRVSLPALSRQKMMIDVAMPAENFDGVIAGGVTFSEVGQENDGEKASGISVKNTYSYTIALVMRQNKTEVSPILKLGKIQVGQVNGRNVIKANLQNPVMAYLNTMNVEASVVSKANPKLKYTLTHPMMQMAPNTNFNLAIPTSAQSAATRVSEPLKAGEYELHLLVSARTDPKGKYKVQTQGKQQTYRYQWKFDQDFSISAAKAEKLNKSDPTVKEGHSWFLISSLLGVLFVFLLLAYLLWRRHKRDKQEAREKELLEEKIRAQEALIEQLNQQKKDLD